MGIFDRFYYGKAGKADYTEMDMPKNRIQLFFQVVRTHFFDLIKVNLLQLIFWIPFIAWTFINLLAVQSLDPEVEVSLLSESVRSYVAMWLIGLVPCILITGPSSAGSAYVMRNWARDEHAFLFSDFKDAFKDNWKQALLTSAVTSIVPILVYTAVNYYGYMASSMPIMYVPLVIVLSAVVMFAFMLPLMYPMMVGYELRFRDLIRNAFLMAAARLPRLLLTRLITLIPIVVLVVGMLIGNGIMLLIVLLWYVLIGFAMSRLIYASVAHGIFDIYLNPRIEGAQVRQGLRPEDADELDLEDEEDEDDGEDA